MYFSFASALSLLGPNFALRLLNAQRAPAEYRLAQYLPAMTSTDYDVARGNMIVRTTMAGLVGMDSPYPEGGAATIDTWYEQTAKIAIANDFNEATLRTLQRIARDAQLSGGNSNRAIADSLLNVTDKLITQALMDREEWMRGQALGTGSLVWTFNRKTINVNYGLPAANIFANRTGTAAYGGSASAFWDDWRKAQDLLGWTGLSVVAHPSTINAIVNNPANNAVLTSQGADGSVTLRRYTSVLGQAMPSADARDSITIRSVGGESEIIDLTDATPPMNTTKKVAFFPRGKIAVIGQSGALALIGQGSTPVPKEALGYLHIGPTVEGNGTAGRWGRVFTPENRPFALRYEGAENVLPVITDPMQLVILSTEMPAGAQLMVGGRAADADDEESGADTRSDEEIVIASVKQAEENSQPATEERSSSSRSTASASAASADSGDRSGGSSRSRTASSGHGG